MNKKTATGVGLSGGRKLSLSEEVILWMRGYQTQQILLLSGVGPAEALVMHNIEQLVDSPEMGQSPEELVSHAPEADSKTALESHPDLTPDFCQYKALVVHAPVGAQSASLEIFMDGTHVASAMLETVPTSHGSVSVASAGPTASPIIDPTGTSPKPTAPL
ncbi:MAG: hypothetical protein M1818_004046 [Claussenomyces sp. TS43310]|nr:MAG: hypothetical protein M1818_004046 [Claussenomyces sp. TS43310]